MLTFTTCKRFDLFKQTINSILNHWLDINKVDYWFCVDDNSSETDRNNMKLSYPWIEYHMKTIEEKGHRKSMNIIWNKLNELKPTYWIHMEDDFLFHNKMNYIEDSVNAINSELCKNNNVKQILFNRNYGETIEHYNIKGHILDSNYNKIALHKHINGAFNYQNCHYWPHYSFRPSLIDVKTILEIGNYDSENTFFEMDYAKKWHKLGYTSAFFNKITNRHIGRLTNDKNTKNVKNAYELNDENQFNKENNIILHIEENNKVVNISNNINFKIINLERRQDRKEETIKKLTDAGINKDQYEFINAVDGQKLESTQEIFELFKENDFGNRRGVIGCALSHYNLWKRLLTDKDNEYYLIMEDDFSLCSNFKTKIESLKNEFISKDFIFLGYHMFENEREKVKNIYDNDLLETIKVTSLNKNLYIGGYFTYSINKNGAKILINYIENNGIKHGIDYLNKIINSLKSYECQPQLVFSVWNEGGKKIDSDIQNIYDGLDFSNLIKNDGMNNIYINGISGLGNNLFQIAVGIYYKETYNNCNIFLNKNSETLNEGTANKFGKRKLKTSYFNTILKKFNTVNHIPKCETVIYNDCFTLNKIDLSNTSNSNILISGYCQNIDLIFNVREKLLDYFNLDDTITKETLIKKYNVNDEAINIMLGIRIGRDGGFKYSNFTKESYKKVIDIIVNSNSDKIINIYVLSDVENIFVMIDKSDKYNVIFVDEDDINQMYIGLMCKYFILSDSTYHWWIAFLKWSKDPSVIVYYFNNTDITKRLVLNSTIKNEWRHMDIIPNEKFIFIKSLDIFGNDIFYINESVPILMDYAENNKNCVGFNTLGFFKNNINLDDLKKSPYFDENDGIYIKKEYYDILQNKKNKKNINNAIRIKMLCNWCSSEQLCKEWSNMCEEGFRWKNFELVWSNKREDIDYYVIINSPNKNEYFDPSKTIVFQMEPWVYDMNKNWGVKTWGNWAEPDPAKFLEVRGRKTEHCNLVQNHTELRLTELNNPSNFEKINNSISSIMSNKYIDEGHILRIDFLKYLEQKGDLQIDIYGESNNFNFINYKGKLPMEMKSKGIKSYKYYFMMENNFERNYITEKLWDPIFCECLCFYYGCPNVTDYIDSRAFVLLDVNDFEKSYQIIKKAIEEDLWSQRIDIIRKEKQRILNEMTFFPIIEKIINK